MSFFSIWFLPEFIFIILYKIIGANYLEKLNSLRGPTPHHICFLFSKLHAWDPRWKGHPLCAMGEKWAESIRLELGYAKKFMTSFFFPNKAYLLSSCSSGRGKLKFNLTKLNRFLVFYWGLCSDIFPPKHRNPLFHVVRSPEASTG